MTISLLAACLLAAPPDRLVILDLTGPPVLARRITDDTLVGLGRSFGTRVVGEAELTLAHGYLLEARAAGACDEGCLAEWVRAADAEWVLQGSLAELGGEWLIAWTLLGKDGGPRASRAGLVPKAELAEASIRLARGLVGTDTSTSTPGPAPVIALGRLAVLPLGAYEEGAPTAALTQLLLLELRRRGHEVISPDEIRALLDYEAERQIRACEEDLACLAEIGGALGVEQLITGSVGRIGDEWVVGLKLLGARTAEVYARSAQTFRGPESELVPALRAALRELLGAPTAGGELVLEHEDSIAVELDGAPAGLLPLRRSLPAGKHQLRLSGEGWRELRRDVYVEPEETTRVVPELIAEPWWTRPGPWIALGIGAAVITAVGIGAAAALSEPQDGVVAPELIVR